MYVSSRQGYKPPVKSTGRGKNIHILLLWSIAMVLRPSTPTTHSVARLADRWRIPIHTLTVAKARNISTKLTHTGAVLIGADILLSGEIKPSHLINGAMLGVSTTGVGTIIAGVWFIADYGTMGINYIFTGEAKGISDIYLI